MALGDCYEPLALFFFSILVLRPFQEYFTYIEPIVHQRCAKTGELGGKNHLTIRKQNLAVRNLMN